MKVKLAAVATALILATGTGLALHLDAFTLFEPASPDATAQAPPPLLPTPTPAVPTPRLAAAGPPPLPPSVPLPTLLAPPADEEIALAMPAVAILGDARFEAAAVRLLPVALPAPSTSPIAFPSSAAGGDPALGILALGIADRPLAPPAPSEQRQTISVARGDTLMGMMTEGGVSSTQAHEAVEALAAVFDPRHLQVGQEITLVFSRAGRETAFTGLELAADVDTTVIVARQDEGFAASEVTTPLEKRRLAAAGDISSSLYASTNAAGVPDAIVVSLIREFSYAVDFQRDVRQGDAFAVMYDQEFDENGDPARSGDVLYAALTLSGRTLAIYRYETSDGFVEYFDRDGESMRRLLMRTPIDGARMSSGFGMRRHPVLGYSRMHRGTDFAAPTGTPIYAAGNGVIDFIGNNRGYGRYIRIRHSGGLSTAYAHMSRFAKGLGQGSRVEQGEVIGFVGTTGLSTGPHLHYEVLQNGTQINPMAVDLPTGRNLEGRELVAFRTVADEIDREFALMAPGTQVAESPGQ